MKKLFIAMVIALAIPASALAYFGAPYWTTDKAESTVYNSKWAEDHDMADISCSGIGRHRLDSAGEPTYKKFYCDLEVIHDFHYFGAVSCYGSAIVNVISDTRFFLTGIDGIYDDGQVDNCDIPNSRSGN